MAAFGEAGKDELEPDELKGRIVAQFGDVQGEGGWFGFDDSVPKAMNNNDDASPEERVKKPGKITCIACMNAFHPTEVDRAAGVAFEAGLVTSLEDCSGMLYLTGAVREEGLEAALQKCMKVVCVGHRLCEVWGIAYLAEKVKERWPEVDVQVIDEEEVKPSPKEKKEAKSNEKKKKKTTKNVVEPMPKQQEHDSVRANEAIPTAKRRRTNSGDKDDDGGVML